MLNLKTDKLLKITPEQKKGGWMEIRGVTPIHHEFVIISGPDDQGNYVAVAPKVSK
jgi:hypothetical protein